jgi:RNA polymerase sigma factor (sigma-70 family)
MEQRSDADLMREYVSGASEEAMAQLVHRHVDLVYSAAFRVLRNACLSEEVTQRVFIALARNAVQLQGRAALSGWLHETTRNFAITTVRSEERRRAREQEAAKLSDLDRDETERTWERIAPHVDESLAQLDEADRDVILWRYFERKTAREIAERLGLTEEAAQKRATRALDRLRSIFARRGLGLSATGFPAILSMHGIQVAPAGVTASVIGVAGIHGTAIATTSTIGLLMASTKIKVGMAALLLAGASTQIALLQRNTRLREEIAMMRRKNAEPDPSAQASRQSARSAEGSQEQQRRPEIAELMRLRNEVARLREEMSRSVEKQGKNLGVPEQDAPHASAGGPALPAANWANVGFATPAAALQTVSWARANRDTNLLASSVAWPDEKMRASVEALFAAAPEAVRARYGSADNFVITQMNDLSLRQTTDGYRIIAEETKENRSDLEVEYFFDGGSKRDRIQFVRVGDRWLESLDFSERLVQRFAGILQVQMPAERSDEEM